MKTLSLTLFLIFICSFGFSQNTVTDSLKKELSFEKTDTNRVLKMAHLSFEFDATNQDSSLYYAYKALDLARKIHFSRGEARVLERLGEFYWISGDYPKSLDFAFKGLKIAKDNHFLPEMRTCLNCIGLVYVELKDYENAINYCQQALVLNSEINNDDWERIIQINIARSYRNAHILDSASIYFKRVEIQENKLPETFLSKVFYTEMGSFQFDLGNHHKAIEYLHRSISINKKVSDHRLLALAYTELAGFFKKMNQADSCIYYAKNAIVEAESIGAKKSILDAANLLTELYDTKNLKEALYYNKLVKSINEELYGASKVLGLQKIIAEEQIRQREIETKRIAKENLLKQYAFLTGLAILLLIAFILYRNNRQKQKANQVLEKTLSTLKSTQAQLIQSEKLASLGELTAGIAHEIQNPLNFVNNFAEMSVSLANELKEEVEKPEMDIELIIDLANDLSENQEKINHHGKRASSIVSGMLQHSQASSGKKELTDINKLADESLRLSYHGLRAKDKTFNSDFELIADPNLSKINVIPQDIGRVLINLVNNAFYAVANHAHVETGHALSLPTQSQYHPTVIISTEQIDNQVVIAIKDNGIGMSEATKAKIFQPFFTTKPTGQGTGLGLSLAYDIITKGHGGTIECESVEGEGTTFVVKLPIV